MSNGISQLYDDLQQATSEEDVKDAYIKSLGLTNYNKNLVDLRTDTTWFEAKMGSKYNCYEMFAQLLWYVYHEDIKGEVQLPSLLCVIDQEKAAIMKTSSVLGFLRENTVPWGNSASSFTKETVRVVSEFIGVHFIRFDIKDHMRAYEFRTAFHYAEENGTFPLIDITPDNLRQVFDRWVEMIGKQATEDQSKYVELFFADIMTDGTKTTHPKLKAKLIKTEGNNAFYLGNQMYELENTEQYRAFWDIYNRPPEEHFRDYLLARRDSLLPLDERVFKGAFYTPLNVVDKAYETLTKTLGPDWQKEYIIWDMCCGVGNLEVKHSNHRNIFMSTLDQEDVDVMVATKTCVAANRFTYDYLNDDIADDGTIDYSMTEQVPQELRDAIASGKKILVLINPPYAEAGNSKGNAGKSGVSKNKFAEVVMQDFGKARNELYVQFLVRLSIEIPNAVVAMFSKLKHVNGQNFERFRLYWDAEYKGGFIVHSKSFEGLSGDFPIGFLVWQTHHGNDNEKYTIDSISTEMLDKNTIPMGEKIFQNLPNEGMLNKWIDRPRANGNKAIPLKNAVSPRTVPNAMCSWADNALGYMLCDANDFQGAVSRTSILSSAYGNGHGFFVTPENIEKTGVVFTVRKVIKPDWHNSGDQFLIPTQPLTDWFKNDALIYLLFHGCNLTAGANDLEWNDEKWSIVNHFIPFTEAQVGSPDRFESDFMVQYLAGKRISKEAKAVMAEGLKIWKMYFATEFSRDIYEQYKLNRSDVGWYQIRNALKEHGKQWDTGRIKFTEFNEAYERLSAKLRNNVYEFGFLKS